MNPEDPESAQQIVAEYAQVLEQALDSSSLPAPVDSLPYAKATIKAAIHTSVLALKAQGALTRELHEFLETAYVSLADYLPADLVRLMTDYQRAGADLAADARLVKDKLGGEAWRTVSETSGMAGEIARTVSREAETLREEFAAFAA
jgi:hypothetical protein